MDRDPKIKDLHLRYTQRYSRNSKNNLETRHTKSIKSVAFNPFQTDLQFYDSSFVQNNYEIAKSEYC